MFRSALIRIIVGPLVNLKQHNRRNAPRVAPKRRVEHKTENNWKDFHSKKTIAMNGQMT